MLVAALIALDLAGSLVVSDRTELRARAPGTSPAVASIDAETAPAVRLTLASRRLRWTLGYAPRLTLRDMGTAAAQPTLFHGGEARVECLGRRVGLSVAEIAGYGGVSLASPLLTPGLDGQPPRVEPVPGLSVVQLASSSTALSTRLTLRRWVVSALAGYQLSGGVDAAARAILPRQAGPFGEASAAYALSRTDQAIATLTAADTAFSSGPETVVAAASLGYRRSWSRHTATSLALGLSEVRARVSPSAAQTYETYPVAEGVLDVHGASLGDVDAQVGVRLGPIVNRLTGLADDRVQGTLSASYRHRRLTTRALASASLSLSSSDPSATSLFAGELGVAYGATRAVTLDAGVRGLWQQGDATSAAGTAFAQATAFIGVSLQAPPARW